MITVCCDAFGLHYAPTGNTVAFEKTDDDEWHIEGCCHGCYVVQGMEYCPYCGTQIKPEVIIDAEKEE